jgi:hypothetical protein
MHKLKISIFSSLLMGLISCVSEENFDPPAGLLIPGQDNAHIQRKIITITEPNITASEPTSLTTPVEAPGYPSAGAPASTGAFWPSGSPVPFPDATAGLNNVPAVAGPVPLPNSPTEVGGPLGQPFFPGVENLVVPPDPIVPFLPESEEGAGELEEEEETAEEICDSDADCRDGDACNIDTCTDGSCSYEPVDCDDGDNSTDDMCDANGICVSTPALECIDDLSCESDSDCDDTNACTRDLCVDDECQHTIIASCTPCTSAEECDDDNPCTMDTCSTENRCVHTAISGCVTCVCAEDCEDSNPCTINLCQAGACNATTISTCTACSSVADCDDGDSCTTNACTLGECVYSPIPDCTSLHVVTESPTEL